MARVETSLRTPEVEEIGVNPFSSRRHSCLPGRDSSRPSSGIAARVGIAEMSRLTPDVVEFEASPAAGMCALRVAGNLACRRPFRPPGGLESPPAARIGCHTTASCSAISTIPAFPASAAAWCGADGGGRRNRSEPPRSLARSLQCARDFACLSPPVPPA